MPTAAGSDYYFAPPSSPRDLCPRPVAGPRSHSADGSRQSSAVRFAVFALPVALVDAPAFLPVSAASPAALLAPAPPGSVSAPVLPRPPPSPPSSPPPHPPTAP